MSARRLRVAEPMVRLLIGLVMVVIAGFSFWKCLPRDGQVFRFAKTEWEPYVGVAFTTAVVLGFSMALSGAIEFFG
jgi:hypothetical protein